MPALTASDVTVKRIDMDFLSVANVVGIYDVSFGDSSKTYPSGGIPLGTIGKFGFNREIRAILIEDVHGDGYVRKVDRANMKLRIYHVPTGTPPLPLVEVGTTHAPAAQTIRMVMIGS